MPTRILISYSHRDNVENKYHVRLRDYINKQLGVDVWYDLDIPAGSNWASVIDDELEKATHLVLIWTPNVTSSEHVNYEWGMALLREIPIIPIQSPIYETFKPSQVPELLVDLNFINDPIEESEEQAKLLKGIIEGTTPVYTPNSLPFETIKKLRVASAENWSAVCEEFDTWSLAIADLKVLRQVEWLLSRVMPPFADSKQKQRIRDLLKKLGRQIEDTSLRISHASIIEFRSTLSDMAINLQAANVPGETIQKAVQGLVKAWSLAQYGTPRPPAPDIQPGDYFTPSTSKCGYCKLTFTMDKKGTCVDCGLFYSWWRDVEQKLAQVNNKSAEDA